MGWEVGAAWPGSTHQEQVHHVVLCHVAVLGGVLHGLWKEGREEESPALAPGGGAQTEPAAGVGVRVWIPRCSTSPSLPPPTVRG